MQEMKKKHDGNTEGEKGFSMRHCRERGRDKDTKALEDMRSAQGKEDGC